MRAHRPLLAAALALGLCVASAHAQPADTAQLGTEVAHELFTAVNMSELMRQGALSNASAFDAFSKVRPEWKPLMLEAIDETVVQDRPVLETVLGRAFAKSMTAEELTAGLTVFRDPQARAAIAAATRHESTGAAPNCSRECMRAMSSPAGARFLRKMQTAMGPELQSDIVAAMVPDLFIRFGEKAKAAEAKRAAR
jgi:hypothetical protein